MDTRTPGRLRSALIGCLLGTAVGDAVGLPAEGLSRRRQRLFFGNIDAPRLLPRKRGMVSDDTEHAALVAVALLKSSGDPDRFTSFLAHGLKLWFLTLPAGIGLATLRACFRLLVGIRPERSGVFSAGNGPAMRAPLLGVYCGGSPESLRTLIRSSTRLTHTDPKAEYGAGAGAIAADLSACHTLTPSSLLSALHRALADQPGAEEMLRLAEMVTESVQDRESTPDFALRLCGGDGRVSGYVYQTVPVALHASLSFPQDLRAAVVSVVACGGDTDTIGAITGGIVGAGVGAEGIPLDWLAGLWEWPRSVAYLTTLGERLAAAADTGSAQSVPPLFFPALYLRSIIFSVIVLLHGVRRLLPPY